MQKVICKKVYDTETSTLIKKVTFGEFGCPKGYEESLYQTEAVFSSSTPTVARKANTPKKTSPE